MAKKGSKRKKLGGGAKQRMKQRHSGEPAKDEEDTVVRSELAHYLLSRFAWGEMSPQELQRMSMYACRDFAAARASSSSGSSGDGSLLIELQELAKIGSQGNLSRFS